MSDELSGYECGDRPGEPGACDRFVRGAARTRFHPTPNGHPRAQHHPRLRRLVAGRGGHEPLVDLSERQIGTRWEAVRDAIGRPDVRWKDLRGIFATYYLQAGGDPRTLQHVLGHATMSMTLRYLRRLPVGSRRHVSEAAKRVGLLKANLKAVK